MVLIPNVTSYSEHSVFPHMEQSHCPNLLFPQIDDYFEF